MCPQDKLTELQENLIRSHAAGCGEPIPRTRTRMLLALRINVLAKGHSGISLGVVEQMMAALNADCIPVVPCQGTVGASGDLAPLAHLALGLMGEGRMWVPGSDADQGEAGEILASRGLSPIRLAAKEGLAMINGTQMIAALGSEALERAASVARLADYVAALTLEVLFGTTRAFNPLIHEARPHPGQRQVAARVRAVLRSEAPSELYLSHQYAGKVQDAYSLRCVPQVHGIAHDTIGFVRRILEVEINSATDNPMCFTQAQVEASAPWCVAKASEPHQAATPGPVSSSANAKGELEGGGAVELEPVTHTTLDAANAEIAKLKMQLAGRRSNDGAPGGSGGRREATPVNDANSAGWSFFKKDSDTLRAVSGGGVILSGGNFHGEYPAKVG